MAKGEMHLAQKKRKARLIRRQRSTARCQLVTTDTSNVRTCQKSVAGEEIYFSKQIIIPSYTTWRNHLFYQTECSYKLGFWPGNLLISELMSFKTLPYANTIQLLLCLTFLNQQWRLNTLVHASHSLALNQFAERKIPKHTYLFLPCSYLKSSRFYLFAHTL